VKITRGPNLLHAVIKVIQLISPLCDSHRSTQCRGGFDQKAAERSALVVNEAIANIIRHAYDSATINPSS